MAIVKVEAHYMSEYGDDSWCVVCDSCKIKCKNQRLDPGAAAEAARKEGFQSRTVGSKPSTWKCFSCVQKESLN